MSLEIVLEHRGCHWVSVDTGFLTYKDVLWDATKETSCIKMKYRQIWCADTDSIRLAQNTDQWQGLAVRQ